MTVALQSRGMWENTVLVVMGDNGGPMNNGHNNGPLRGGKLNWWEGGVRPFAFVSSPLLRQSPLWGQWFNDTVHETDWFATFAALAGAPLPRYGIDGRNVWPTLTTGRAHRTEALIGDHILRVGRYKLIAGGGSNETEGEGWRKGFLRDCMLGTQGGLAVSNPTLKFN